MDTELAGAAAAFLVALFYFMAAELRARTARRLAEDARRRAIDAQTASGATRRADDAVDVVRGRRDPAHGPEGRAAAPGSG